MTTTAGEQMIPFHFEASRTLPILGAACRIDPDVPAGSSFGQTHMNGLGIPPQATYECQAGYVVSRHRGFHETIHAFIAFLYYWVPVPPGGDWRERLWTMLGYQNTYAQQFADANAQTSAAGRWNTLPEERMAEAGASALDGFQLDDVPSPDRVRSFLVDLMYEARPSLRPAPPPPVVVIPPTVSPPPPAPAGPLRVLWHLSHHSSARPDGWSGAPDEARWIREDLTPRVVTACRALGIGVVLVDGDLADHPEFHADYRAFVAPHYESDTHDDHIHADPGHNTRSGWFWGRATNSATAAEDDKLGAIFERRYRELLTKFPDGPDEHEDWTTVNVLDYYGFRFTTARTPGILPELGVGAPGDPNNDHDWLRAHVQDIADVLALSLAEFLGQEDDMTPEEAKAIAEKVLADAGLDPNTVEVIKDALRDDAEALRKLANDETFDDTEVAALTARIDKLHAI